MWNRANVNGRQVRGPVYTYLNETERKQKSKGGDFGLYLLLWWQVDDNFEMRTKTLYNTRMLARQVIPPKTQRSCPFHKSAKAVMYDNSHMIVLLIGTLPKLSYMLISHRVANLRTCLIRCHNFLQFLHCFWWWKSNVQLCHEQRKKRQTNNDPTRPLEIWNSREDIKRPPERPISTTWPFRKNPSFTCYNYRPSNGPWRWDQVVHSSWGVQGIRHDGLTISCWGLGLGLQLWLWLWLDCGSCGLRREAWWYVDQESLKCELWVVAVLTLLWMFSISSFSM